MIIILAVSVFGLITGGLVFTIGLLTGGFIVTGLFTTISGFVRGGVVGIVFTVSFFKEVVGGRLIQ